MKIFRYISGLAAALMLTGCAAEEISLPAQPDFIDNGDTFSIKVSLDVPDMAQTMTRAMGATPDYSGLKLYVLEFEGNGDNPASSFYNRKCEVTSETVADGHVNFTLQLYKETTPKVLHLIAVPKSETISVSDPQSEAVVIPSITVSGGHEAYWQRVVFPEGYGTLKGSVTDEGGVQFVKHDKEKLEDKLKMVPMVRNFCAVNVKNEASTFTLEGFVVTNTPRQGIVAPWNAALLRFEPFHTYEEGNSANATPIPFSTLKETYTGIRPNNLYNTAPTESDINAEEKYLYESPFNSGVPTRVIVKGTYNNKTNYYKIDIGEIDEETKEFTQYNLLRNIRYTINIKSVTSEGYDTFEGAMGGSVANNLSYDVSSSSMPTISNGSDMLQVSYTYKIIMDDESRDVEFSYRYRQDIETTPAKYLGPDDGITTTLSTGTAIESVSDPVKGADGWVTYKLTVKSRGDDDGQLRQSFVVRNNSTGLARTVELVLTNPFEITRNEVYGGNYDVGDEFPYDKTELRSKVETGVGKELTVFFTIPDNLPQSMFPLRFDFESDKLNIENNQIGNLVVSSGESVFDSSKTTIHYTKTISWTDYNTCLLFSSTGALVAKRNNEGNIIDENNQVIGDGNLSSVVQADGTILNQAYYDRIVWMHHIRARFTTITENDGGEETTIRITNPYFCLGEPDPPSEQNKPATTTGKKGGVVEVKFTRIAEEES